MSNALTDDEFRTFFERYPNGAPVRELIRYSLKVEALFGPQGELHSAVNTTVAGLSRWASEFLISEGREPKDY